MCLDDVLKRFPEFCFMLYFPVACYSPKYISYRDYIGSVHLSVSLETKESVDKMYTFILKCIYAFQLVNF